MYIYQREPPNLCSIYNYYRIVGCTLHVVEEPLRLPYSLLYLPLSHLHVAPPLRPIHLAFGGAIRGEPVFLVGLMRIEWLLSECLLVCFGLASLVCWLERAELSLSFGGVGWVGSALEFPGGWLMWLV